MREYTSILTPLHDSIVALYQEGKSPSDIKCLLSISITVRAIQRYIKDHIGARTLQEGHKLAHDKQVTAIRNHWKGYVKARKTGISPTTRMRIFQRDNFHCVLCGRGVKEGAILNIDHIIPKTVSILNEDSNLRTLCFDCNIVKR